MVDENITNTRNKSTRNGEALETDRASVRPQAGQSEIERSCDGVRPNSNKNQEEKTVGTASVGRRPSPVPERHGSGRGRLRAD